MDNRNDGIISISLIILFFFILFFRAIYPILKERKLFRKYHKKGEPYSVELLVDALRNKNGGVRERAVRELCKIKYPKIVESLIITALNDEYIPARIESIKALGKKGNEKAVKPLIRILEDNDSAIREATINALCRIGDTRAVEPLITALRHPGWHTREAIIRYLGLIGDPKAVEPLVAILKNVLYALSNGGDTYAVSVSDAIVNALVNIGKSAVETLITELSDKDWRVRQTIARILGLIEDQRAVKPLIATLKDNKIEVRKTAVDVLAKIGKLSSKPLIDALGDEDSKIREGAAEVLGNIGDVMAVEPLMAVLGDKNSYVRSAAAEAQDKLAIIPRLRNIYPHLFCTDHLLRAEKIKVTLDAFHKYTYVGCRSCKGFVNLTEGITEVIGLIGGDIKDYKQDGEKVYVNLWFENEKKARNADIDILEIRESDGISYDWAVNAVLNELKNDVSRPSKYVKSIPVIIKGNPPLSENSKTIFEHEFGGIR